MNKIKMARRIVARVVKKDLNNLREAGLAGDLFNKIKTYAEKVPGLKDILNLMSGKDPKEIMATIIRKMGLPTQEDIDNAKKLHSILFSNKSASEMVEAGIFESFRNIKKTVMTMVLLSLLSGITGKTFAGSSTEMSKQFLDFSTKQKAEFAQFVNDAGDEFAKYIQDSQGDSDDSKSPIKQLDSSPKDVSPDDEEVKEKIPSKAMTPVKIHDISQEELSKAEVKDLGEESKIHSTTPEVAKSVADSIINKDVQTLSKSLSYNFNLNVQQFDYQKDLNKITDPKIKDMAKATKAKFCNIQFKQYKEMNKDILNKMDPELKQKIKTQYDPDSLTKLLARSFVEKMKSDGLIKIINENADAKNYVMKALADECTFLSHELTK